MSSGLSQETSTPSQPKSKQERTRDNQRRSRARRQEYLADIERRLSECQITCREADIQHAAFLELQIENARLRELLALAGVSGQSVEIYTSQAVAQSGQFPRDTNPALRQLRPKISPAEPARPFASNSRQPLQPRVCGRLSSTIATGTSTTAHMKLPDTPLTSTLTSSYDPGTFSMKIPEMGSTPSPEWLVHLSPPI